MTTPRARAWSVAAVFAISGFAMAAWLSRLPAVRDALQVGTGQLGLIMVAMSLGSVLALPSSGPVVHRLGPRRTVTVAAIMTMIALIGISFGGSVQGRLPLLIVSMFLAGAGIGLWDVAMNVEGADAERAIERPIMPWFHAAFSLGTVVGALSGSLAAAFSVPLTVHLPLVAVMSLMLLLVAVSRFKDRQVEVPDSESSRGSGSGTLRAWTEPRTLALGVLVLGMALAEGSANDWLALGLVDGYRLNHAWAAAGLALFLAAMTACRLSGPWLLDRYGRVRVLRGGAVLVLVGVLLYVAMARLVDTDVPRGLLLVLAAVAIVLWGVGSGLGFPVGMSAAADDPALAAARVSVVASIGYVAFLAGPPLLGLLGDRIGTVNAMLVVGVAVALSLIASGAAGSPPEQRIRVTTPSAD